MKRWIVLGCCLGGIAVTALAWYTGTLSRAQPTASGPISGPGDGAVLGVEALMRDVDRHRGPVRVKGVVSAVAAQGRTFALIDLREFEACGLANCALTLPVRWTGDMPAVRDVVVVNGDVREADGKLVFVASTMEKMNARAVKANEARH